MRPFETPNLKFFEWYERQWMYLWVRVSFVYTLVTHLSDNLFIEMPRKFKTPLFALSIVNSILGSL